MRAANYDEGTIRMLPLTLGLLLFFAVHLVPTSPSLRQGLSDRFGESAYKIGFSILSLVAFVLIVLGYHKLQLMPGKNPVLWDPPSWTRHIAFLLMLPAMILLVAAFVPSRIRTAAKHPMLAAIKAWALSHLLVNGDLGSLVLFGGFLAFAVYDRISMKRRPVTPSAATAPPAAINDVIVVVGGLALYAFMMIWGHGALIGVPLVSFAP
ncbi:MAG TPA: NnrU family protein [Hyphomicrobium sp.]|nr:NnrU family protein [Hyphomicrobium sp.]